ncbi:MAG: GlsB/YeaQ/YmgE family stress response membrane protein [Actinomycetota bacterium]|nr:GlsB/YeaQ/YmgE family stress response membrane protein [Actinomycetota bacterium]
MEIISLIIVGAIVGALARLVIPGPNPMGMLITIIIGIVGTLIGNYIGEAISPDGTIHWILAVIVAVLLTLGYAALNRRRVT